jgi:hypothetical protein
MASPSAYTPVSVAVANTAATGGANIAALVTAHNASCALAVATAAMATGVNQQNITVSPSLLTTDTNSGIYIMLSTVNYQTYF